MAVIYIYSKADCPNCETAISLLAAKNKVFKVKKLDVDYTLPELLKVVAPARPSSLPQIVLDDFGETTYIGGLPELIKFLKGA